MCCVMGIVYCIVCCVFGDVCVVVCVLCCVLWNVGGVLCIVH